MSKIDTPLVTVGISFFNAGEYLRYAILSVINQSYSNWELILINDGSNDNFLSIISEFNDNRIRLIDDGQHLGLPKRLNQISTLANGSFCVRMDADDIMHHDRIRIQVEYLISHTSIDVIGSHAYYIDSENNVLGVSKKQILTPTTIHDILFKGAFMHPTVMARTDWFRKNNYDESLLRMQDLALWLKTVTKSKFYILPDKLLFYRIIEISTLSKYLSTQKYLRKFILDDSSIFKYNNILVYKLYIFSFCKSVLYILFHLFKRIDFFIEKRYTALSLENSNNIHKDLLFSIRKCV